MKISMLLHFKKMSPVLDSPISSRNLLWLWQETPSLKLETKCRPIRDWYHGTTSEEAAAQLCRMHI